MTYKKTKKSKKLLVGLLVALVVVAGYAYHSQTTKAHELVTSDNILDVLAEKFAELLITTSEKVDQGIGFLGGQSNFGILSADYIRIGKTASTTNSTERVYEFNVTGDLTGAEQYSFWRNETQSDVFLVDFKLFTNPSAVSTSTFHFIAATTTEPQFAAQLSSNPYQGDEVITNIGTTSLVLHYRFATSSPSKFISATTTKLIARESGVFYRIPRGDYLDIALFAHTNTCFAQGLGGVAAGARGKCEEATSTNTGIKPITWWATFVATTTVDARR